MGIDVTKYHQTFFDESFEGLEVMETGLLDLEGADDNEAINTIFRAAHSIKGGAGVLGFTAMSEFTHLVETILDRRRSGQSEVTREVIDVLLESVDCLRAMLSGAQDGADLDTDRIASVEARLQGFVERDTGSGSAPPAPASSDGADDGATDPDRWTSIDAAPAWEILFAPHPELFRTGNDPARILDELSGLGRYQVEAELSELPELQGLDVDVCYCSWLIELRADEDGPPIERGAITEVFEWVEDDAHITITPLVDRSNRSSDTTPTGDGSGPGGSAPGPKPGGPAGGPGRAKSDNPPNGPLLADFSERRAGSDRRMDRSGATTTSIRVDIDKVDTLINMVGELVITQSMLQQLATHGDEIDHDRLREGLAELESNTRELQGSVMQIRMLPISFSFSRIPRLVRDLASKLGKQVDLQIFGETTELDKTVMEKISDPLVHLVRNACDHGLETPGERVAAGKAETGTITLSAYHEGGTIVIEIIDDGGGINGERILAKARERGLVGPDEKLNEKQINDLIFHPGFSTAETVSDVSGRGVGMDVVKRNISDLGGVIEVETALGRGTTFRIRLPLTLAILDGQVVRVGSQLYIIPLISIVESLQFDRELIGSMAKGADVYRHRGEVIPLIALEETFGLESGLHTDPLLVIIDAGEGTRAAFIVDDLLAQQQIVIKSLTTNFRAVPGLSGATILGDGTVALIIDVNSVLELYRQVSLPAGQVAGRVA